MAKILPAAGSIRRRVFFLLGGMSLGAILVTNLIWLPSAVEEIRQDQIELRHVSVQLVHDQVQQYLEDKEKNLTATAQRFRPALVEGDREGLRIIGQRLLQSDPSFEEVGILNEKGEELIRLSRRIAITDQDLTDRSKSPLFREGMKQENYWGPVMITETSEPWVTLTIRLPSSATSLRGLVFGIINLKSLWNLTREFKLSHEGRAYIVEEKGRLVAAADPSIVLRQLSFADRPLIQRLIDPENSNDRSFLEGEYANERGMNVVATGLLLARPLWGVVIEQPKSLLFAPIRHKIWLFAGLSLMGLILSFSLAHILSRRLTGPIIRLREGAEQVGAGNLEYKVSVETDDEIGELASQFNRMAQALKASYQGLEEKIAERTQEISTLYATLAPLAPTDSVNQMLEKVIERVMAVTKADAGLIRTLDKTIGTFAHPAQIGFPSNYLEATQRLQEGSGVALAFKTGEPVIAANIAEDPRLKGKRQIEGGLKSCAFLPLKVAGEVRGVIHLASRELGHFNEEKKDHLMAIARQMGVAMENHELFEQTRRNLERIRAMQEIDRAITSTLDLRTVLGVLLEKIDLVLPYSAVTVRLFNRESGLLEPVACRNLDEEEWKAEQWKGGRGTPNVAFESKAPVMVGNVQIDPRVRDPEFFRKHGLVSYLGVPLIVKDEVLGVISFYTKEEHEFTKEEVEFLSTLAGQAAVAIHNSQLYQEMVSLAAQLSRSNKVKDEFLSVMSHELRTPLNVVMGYTGMIKDGLLGEINPEQEKALEKVMSRARDQLTMVSSILQATQLEAEGVKVEPHEVNLEEFLDDLKLNYALASGKELNIVWDYPPDLPALNTDSDKLKHVLQNLINNAIKFTDKGSVTISAHASPLAPQASERWVELKVSDTGVGIADENLSIIFERFRQVDSSETRKYGGVGIGLYIAKQFTQLLGGRIEAESEPGKGSIFTVTMPCGMSLPQLVSGDQVESYSKAEGREI